jgi:hypothetical protein
MDDPLTRTSVPHKVGDPLAHWSAVVVFDIPSRGSRIWVGSSRSWDEFLSPVTAILRHVEATIKPVHARIPVVAISSIDSTKIVDAFDLGIIPPELLSDETNEQAREEMERWAYHSHFRILGFPQQIR